MLDALAFLPVAEVPDGMQFIKSQIPPFSVIELTQLVAYFDAIYVSGQARCAAFIVQMTCVTLCSLRLPRSAPMFPPPVCNVHAETLADGDRTTTLPRPGTRHLPFSSDSLCWSRSRRISGRPGVVWTADWSGCSRTTTGEKSNAALSCRGSGVCARSARIAAMAASQWPRLCEALVTAFASNTRPKARLDQNVFVYRLT